MPKSKTDKKRKNKVDKFKKKMSELNEEKKGVNPTESLAEKFGMPAVQEVPTWKPNENLELLGREFEILYNHINQLGTVFNQLMGDLYGVANSIMQNNVAENKINVNYEKLTEDENGQPKYVPMTEEEAADNIKALEEFKTKLRETKARIQEEAEAIRQEESAKEAGIVIPTDDEVEKIAKKN